MKEEKSINFNKNECVQSYDKLGTTVYKNVCDNKQIEVPWGIGGWFIFTTIILLILILLTFIVVFIKEFLFE